jgi:hypothetical protein
MPYPSTTCGRPPLKRPYGHFNGGPPAAVFYPFEYEHSYLTNYVPKLISHFQIREFLNQNNWKPCHSLERVSYIHCTSLLYKSIDVSVLQWHVFNPHQLTRVNTFFYFRNRSINANANTTALLCGNDFSDLETRN